jgi:hypothetical protein
LVFYRWAKNPCLERGKPALRLETDETIQSLERKAENRPLRRRHIEVPDDAGPAAKGYDQRILIDAVAEELFDFREGRR